MSDCVCRGEDCGAALTAVRAAGTVAELADESHFGASIRRCPRCGQAFLILFCERIDWADSDDPQTWIAVPLGNDEVKRLRDANVADDEYAILRVITGNRRFLVHDMPKGEPATLTWRTGPLYIPPHD
jgi:hypothetical protein